VAARRTSRGSLLASRRATGTNPRHRARGGPIAEPPYRLSTVDTAQAVGATSMAITAVANPASARRADRLRGPPRFPWPASVAPTSSATVIPPSASSNGVIQGRKGGELARQMNAPCDRGGDR
jgi:hypothetical protein